MSDGDLVKRLRVKADIISLGESIAWGSDSEIMREAADAIERLTRERGEARERMDIVCRWYAEYTTKGCIRAEAVERKVEQLREALTKLLARDERNTCQHDETHRGGVLWEICDSCGAQWADDEGGKPEWKDPSEWTAARAALAETEMKND